MAEKAPDPNVQGMSRRRLLIGGLVVTLPLTCAGLSTIIDLATATASNRGNDRLFDELMAEKNKVWTRAEAVRQAVKTRRDTAVAAGGRIDSRGATWLNVTNPSGGRVGRVYAWPFADDSGFRLEDHPLGNDMLAIHVASNRAGFIVDVDGASPDGTNVYPIRHIEFGNGGSVRMFDGVKRSNGQVDKVEVGDVSQAHKLATGIMDYAQTLLDKAA